MRVMAAGKTIDEKIVGVLHDVVEDTDWTFYALLNEGFPVYIVDALLKRIKDYNNHIRYLFRN